MIALDLLVPVWDATYQRLLQRLPNSASFRIATTTIPFSINPTRFTLTTDLFGPGMATPHTFYLNGTRTTAIIPTAAQTPVDLVLPKGPVEIIVDNGIDPPLVKNVLTKVEATFFSAAAREIYLNAQRILDETEAAIASPFNARLAEHHLAFQDLLPSQRAPRTQAVKMAIRQMVQGFGTERGVRDFITALLYSTPYVNNMVNSPTVDPKVFPILHQSDNFSGFELHVWFPNLCVFTWTAFVRLQDNIRPGGSRITDLSENQVTLTMDGVEERHMFDTDSDACVDAISDLGDCFDSIRVFLEIHFKSDIAFCADAYPFDMLVAVPLGLDLYDAGLAQDGGTLYDQFNVLDPAFNGFLGDSLTNRLDGGRCLDTLGVATRQTALQCCYAGGAVSTQYHSGFDITVSGSFPLGS